MKRWLMLSMVVTFMLFATKINIKADGGEYQGPDGGTFEYMYTLQDTSRLGYVIKAYSHYPFAFVKENPVSGWYRLVTVVDYNNTLYCGYVTTHNGYYALQINAPYPYTLTREDANLLQVSKTDGTKVSHNWTIAQPDTALGGLTLYETYEDAYNALTYVEPTYYYDSTLATPDMNVFILEVPTLVGFPDEETNFFGVTFVGDSNLKLEVYYKTYCPDYIRVGLFGGEVTYEPLEFEESEWLPAYQGNFVTSISNSSFIWVKPVMMANELCFCSSVPVWQNNFENTAFQRHMNNWIDKYSNCLPLYGNKIEIAARYYYDNGNDRYVGPWVQWINTYPYQYNTQIPSNYVAGDYVPGLQNQNNNIDLSDQPIVTGEVTGSQSPVQVTINQSVPNYPDYPTAVSYNHDVYLLQWITTAAQLPGMMGNFGSFLSSAFAFIDPSVWAIIGFGFLCCIAIMIVKVL